MSKKRRYGRKKFVLGVFLQKSNYDPKSPSVIIGGGGCWWWWWLLVVGGIWINHL
jgi:hypothetical protein